MKHYYLLNISKKEMRSKVVIKLNGDLSASTSEQLLNSLPELKNKKVSINCKDLKSLDGSGLQAISKIFLYCQQNKSYFRLSLLSGQPKETISFLNLERLLCKNKKPPKQRSSFLSKLVIQT